MPRPQHRYIPRISRGRRDECRGMGAVCVRDCFDSGQEVTKRVIRTTEHTTAVVRMNILQERTHS